MTFQLPLSALEESSVEDILSKLDNREFRQLMPKLGRNVVVTDQPDIARKVSRDMNFTLNSTITIHVE